jgi:hypothetical protein
MAFDFSDLVTPDDVNENDFFNYDNFLSDAIYDWLKEPEEVLIARFPAFLGAFFIEKVLH